MEIGCADVYVKSIQEKQKHMSKNRKKCCENIPCII